MKYSYPQFLQQIGPKLRAMRKERGWTYRDMIVKHGYNISTWQSIEKGKSMTLKALFRVCEVFDVTLQDLVGESVSEERSEVGAKSGTRPKALPAHKPAKVARKAPAKSRSIR